MPKRLSRRPAAAADRRTVRRIALAIFAAALASRLLFWLSTADHAWGWTAYFKGDAPLWLDWARAIEAGSTFELGLPIHPPGAAYLVSLLWNGDAAGIAFVRFAWVLLGALVPLVVFLAAERSFGLRVAVVGGCWTALSSGLLVLSTSINNETPYLVLAIGALALSEDLRERPRTRRLALWSALNGLACLFRVEHLLFWILALAFLAVGWIRRSRARGVRWAAASLFFFALPLLPWHLSAWSAIRRFNEEPRRLTPSEESAVGGVEQRLARIPWTADAIAERERLPAFLRRTASAFVLATVAHRGGREVRGGDFAILDQAFGYRPRPLARFPFVSSYGPLNFALANHPRARGGFDRSLLEEAPPLSGGASSYPAFLVQGLPPADLSFVYPPHLRLFNEGYALGGEWIRRNPGDFARLAAKKVAIFWSGAASGLTGWDLPVGLSGPRRPVDMVSPDSDAPATIWWIALLLASAAGVVAGRRNRALVPWLLFLATRVAATVFFFGYGRQGATAIPVLAVLFGLAVERAVPARAARLAIPVLAVGVALEAARFVSKPQVRLDGAAIGPADPFPPDEHDTHRVAVNEERRVPH
jgi:Dolichyl-phosphate-mannose-protein mannosyltransferase